MPKRPNWRAIKIHRSYTVEECAAKLGVAKGTVLRWIKSQVLPAITDTRPFLILGSDLKDFGKGGRKAKQKCSLHECYCFTCRAPSEPAARMADLTALNEKVGDLEALCSSCGNVMHKRVSLAKHSQLGQLLDLRFRQGATPQTDGGALKVGGQTAQHRRPNHTAINALSKVQPTPSE